jgi:hypothetical protein
MVELTKRFGVRPRLTSYDTHVAVPAAENKFAQSKRNVG